MSQNVTVGPSVDKTTALVVQSAGCTAVVVLTEQNSQRLANGFIPPRILPAQEGCPTFVENHSESSFQKHKHLPHL